MCKKRNLEFVVAASRNKSKREKQEKNGYANKSRMTGRNNNSQ